MRKLVQSQRERVSGDYVHGFRLWTGREPETGVPADHGGSMRTLRWGAIGSVLLECLFSSALATVTLNLNAPMAACIGLLFTLCATSVAKAVCRVWAAREEARPQKALRDLNVALAWVTPVWVVAFVGVIQFSRMISTGTDLALFIFGGLLTVLTVASPALAGLLFTACDIRAWASRAVAEWHFLDRVEHQLTELEGLCEKVEAAMASPQQPRPSHNAHRPDNGTGDPPATAGAIAAGALLAILCAQGAVAQDHDCAIWFDKSTSPAAAEMASAAESSLRLIARLAAMPNGPSRCSLYGFAGGSFHAASFHNAIFPGRPDETCAPKKKNELALFFKQVSENSRAAEEKRCDDQRQRRRAEYEDETRRQVQLARERLALYSPSAPDKTCIVDLLLRFSQSRVDLPRFTLILTDGEETCSPGYRQVISAPKSGGRVVMALVPQQNRRGSDTPAQRHQHLTEQWQKIAPWVTVVAHHELNERILLPGK